MNREIETKLKKQLEETKTSLSEEITKLEAPVDMGDFPGPDDETDESTQDYNQRSAAASLRTELSDIESALRKIGKGTYGICEECKKEIEEEVLSISPETRLCRNCNKKHVSKKR